MTLGVRRVHVRVQGPGSGRESRDSGAGHGGAPGQVDQGRDADSAQRLPAAEAAEGLSHALYSDPVAGSAGVKAPSCFSRARSASRRSAPSSAVRTRRASTARARRAAASRPSTRKQLREKQKIKRIYGVQRAAVPQHVRAREPDARHHRAQPAGGAREPARQHGVPDGLRGEPQGRAPAHPAPPRRGERQARRCAELSGAPGEEIACAQKSREQASIIVGAGAVGRGARRWRGWRSTERRSAAACSSVRSGRASRSPRRNSWSSSCIRSKRARSVARSGP